MDFTNRGGSTPLTTPPVSNNNNPPTFSNNVGNRQHRGGRNTTPVGWVKWATLGLCTAIVVLVLAVLLSVIFTNPKSQSSYIYNNKLQAVFLNTGQVYFGNIKDINSQYLVLNNIFYLQTNSSGTSGSTSAKSNVSLVKLGCELHAPYDQMVINMQQVTFWENLQSSGQVAKAVAQYDKQYPNGQTCTNQTSGTTPTSTSVQSTPAKAP